MKKTAGYIAVEFVITKEGKQYSSWCPELDVVSESKVRACKISETGPLNIKEAGKYSI